jgi:hypothetical protein
MWGRRTGVQERFASSPLGFDSPRLHTYSPDGVSAPSIRNPQTRVGRKREALYGI